MGHCTHRPSFGSMIVVQWTIYIYLSIYLSTYRRALSIWASLSASLYVTHKIVFQTRLTACIIKSIFFYWYMAFDITLLPDLQNDDSSNSTSLCPSFLIADTHLFVVKSLKVQHCAVNIIKISRENKYKEVFGPPLALVYFINIQ